jgi:hypothetical protein
VRTRVRNPFTTVQTSGLLLPVDLLARIVDGDPSLPGLTPDSYHLNAGERLNEAAARAWNTCVGNWKAFREASRKVLASDQGTTLTRDKWLLPLFRELGYGWLQANKRSLEIDGKPYPVSHQWQSHVPVHLVSFKFDVDRRAPGATGAAQRSPYSLAQEFLNRSAQHRWGFVSNGLKLVVLHDNVSLVRASNVEFDLEAMFEGEVYSDFVLLFALCHQSRVEILAEERPEECWLEKWSKLAEEQGTRAREKLRVGVERAIQALGTGFRTARGNTALNEALRTASLETQEFYRELLRMVYRILLLLVAEDKRLGEDQNLLHPPDSRSEARRRYGQYYSLGRLRKLASLRRGTAHSDLYESLKILFEKLRAGYAPLAIPGLGSFLFSRVTTPHLDAASLANEHLLEAIRHLCYTEDVSGRGGSMLRPVDFGNLGSEELGSVYESLLELHPRIDTDEGPFILAVAAGHERKTTGSYYTPTSLISCLLDSALDPVVLEALSKPDPEAALLSLRICDTACGSGHFLIAATERLAKHLARIRTGDDEPSPTAIQHAKRDIIGRCIFGVDLNPMAVELCKVSLWMEALEPGKPLSFLDHHIQVGNSLLGATPALLKRGIPDEAFEAIEGDDKAVCRDYRKQNRDERNRQTTMFDLFAKSETIRLSNIGPAMARIESMSDDSIEGIHAKDEAFRELKKSPPYEFARLLADAWCAAFVIPKVRVPDLQPRVTLTESTLRKLENNPNVVPREVRDEIAKLADRYQFLHWHLAFLNVFQALPSDEIADEDILGWKGGFDVVLSNPPWERIKIQEQEWFAQRKPDIAKAPNAAARRKMIKELAEGDAILFRTFQEDRRTAEGESQLVRRSGRFPLCGRGDVNTYSLFAELDRQLIATSGRVGIIIPSGIASDDTTKVFFQDLIQTRALVSLHSFENEEFLFPAVHHSTKFCLLTLTGPQHAQESSDFVFFLRRTEQLQEGDRHFILSAEDIRLMNPNTGTCPIFRSKRDAEINKAIYRRVPVLIREGSPEENPWGISFLRMLDMANDSGLFRTREQLEADGWSLDINLFRRGDRTYLPLYEAKMVHHFDHRFGTYEGQTDSQANQGKLPEFNETQHANAQLLVFPRYWIQKELVEDKLSGKWNRQWMLGIRDICRNTDSRTAICSIIPYVGSGGMNIALLNPGPLPVHALMSCLSSFLFDYCVRQKVGGTHLSQNYLKQLPVLLPESVEGVVAWDDKLSVNGWLLFRVLELTYTSWDLAPFAHGCGYNGPPFRWDSARRFLLRCELDAAFFHLYGVNRDDTDYIMETFPVVKKKDIQQHGTYRTKLTILEIYDAMQRAIDTGQWYQTLLDPPPADPHVAH